MKDPDGEKSPLFMVNSRWKIPMENPMKIPMENPMKIPMEKDK